MGLETTLELIRSDYLAKYIAGQIGQPKDQQVPAEEAEKTLQFLREQVASPLAGARLNGSDAQQFARFTSNMNHLLEGLARAHVYEHQPLLHRLGRCDEPSDLDDL